MLDAAVKALSQLISPPMRSILWRSIGLALVLIIVLAIGLQRLLSWFATYGEVWLEGLLGPSWHSSLEVLAWIVSITAGLGVVFGGVFLMPAITSLVASLFVDDVADIVEREHYPAERPGAALPFSQAIYEGVKTALLTIVVYLVALPLVLFRWCRIPDLLRRRRLAARARIFRARRDALPFAGGGQGDAARQRRDHLHRRPFHCGLRLDPDRQSGDADLRHGVHGPHAQAPVGAAARADRAGAADAVRPLSSLAPRICAAASWRNRTAPA
ncbi:hypothetical protein ACVWXQ_006305 [Bradyrhizobium sp. S3.14.4]